MPNKEEEEMLCRVCNCELEEDDSDKGICTGCFVTQHGV